jgi:pimeloyl-ACP methyl ester carboxylesterase
VSIAASVLEERFVDVAGTRMRYLIGGEGPALVLCHGFLSSAEEFGGRFPGLMRARTLIVPDLPGNAASGSLSVPHTSDALAACVDELLAHLCVERFDVAGLCLGASVACALAHRRPTDVQRMVLHTPLIASGLIRRSYRVQTAILTSAVMWRLVVWASQNRTVSDLYKRFMIREGPQEPETAAINFENQARADLLACKEWLRDAMRRDDLSLVEGRREPTLIIVSEGDNLVEVDKLRRLAKGLPHVRLFVDAEGGHGWSRGAVERHLQVLLPFFTEGAS